METSVVGRLGVPEAVIFPEYAENGGVEYASTDEDNSRSIRTNKAGRPKHSHYPNAIRQLVLQGKIKHVKVGTKRLINYADLIDYLAQPVEEVQDQSMSYGKLRRVNP